MASTQAFQANAFQDNAFQASELSIVSNNVIYLPINCVMAGDQPIKASHVEWENRPPRIRTISRMRPG